jgi:hypothetical protein
VKGERPRLVALTLDGQAGPARRLSDAEARAWVAAACARAELAPPRSGRGLRVPSAAAVALGVLALSGGAGASFVAVRMLEPVVIRVAASPPAAALAPRKPRPPRVRPRAAVAPAAAPAAPAEAPGPDLAPRLDPAPAPPPRPRPIDPAEAGGLAAANRLRAAGSWAAAHDAYARIARRAGPGDPEAQAAALAAASLELEHLRRPREALRRYRALAAASSPGIAEEAAWGIAECHRKMGARQAEAAALRLFLARHPASLLRARAEAHLGALEATR